MMKKLSKMMKITLNRQKKRANVALFFLFGIDKWWQMCYNYYITGGEKRMEITKRLINEIAKVDLLGGDECVILTYKDGSKRHINSSDGRPAEQGYSTNERIVNALNKKKYSLTPYELLDTVRMGESYFGRDGLIHVNVSGTHDPKYTETKTQYISPRGVIVHNPVTYALALASVLGSSTMSEAARDIHYTVYEDKNDYEDVKEAFTTFSIEMCDDPKAADAEAAAKILKDNRYEAKVGLMQRKIEVKRLENLFSDDDEPILF